MYYQNQIAAFEGYARTDDVRLKAGEIKFADQLV
jgi:hypothetical protein